MINIFPAMGQPQTEVAMQFAQDYLEHAKDYSRSQLDVTENLCCQLIQECRETLNTAQPSELFQRWPKLLESWLRNSSDGAAMMFRNGINFQNELMQMMQSKLPELNRQIVESVLEPINAVVATAATAGGHMDVHAPTDDVHTAHARQHNGGKAQPARTSKAA